MDTSSQIRLLEEALEALRADEARWQRLDSQLRRMASRLTYAADGRSRRLDASLEKIRRQLREPLDDEELNPLLAELADAVKALDDVVPPSAANPAVARKSLDRAARALIDLLDKLELNDAPEEDLIALREGFAAASDDRRLAAQIEAMANLINRHCRRIGEQREVAEKLLAQVTDQLEALASYLNRESEDRRAGIEGRQELDRQVTQEMNALDDEALAASDLGSLQQGVRSRISSITSHLKQFREREEQRERNWQVRNASMQLRIQELERSAQAMEATLRQEQHLASTDTLTGVANRLVFQHRIAEACQRMVTDGITSSLLVLDIDRFKKVNDTYGHAAGDRALRVVAQHLSAELRPDDLLARYGGEEFVAVLTGTGLEEAVHVAERLRRRIERLGFHSRQQPIRITLSCGVTTLRTEDTPESVFERADRALYQAKRGGRNRCESL